MTSARRLGGHRPVWRTLLAIAALAVAVAMSIVFVSSYLDARAGRDAAQKATTDALARVDAAQAKIDTAQATIQRLEAQLLALQISADADRQALLDGERQLSDQIVSLGAKPAVVVKASSAPTPTTAPPAPPVKPKHVHK